MSLKVASNRVVITAAVAVVSGVAQLVLAKLVGPDQFGAYAFILSLVGLGLSVSVLYGLPTPAIRLFALVADSDSRYQLSAWILRLSLIAGVVCAGVLIIASGIFAPVFDWITVIALLSIPFIARARASGGIIGGLGRTDIAALVTQVAPTIILLFVLVIAWANINARTAAVLVIGWVVGQLIAFAIAGHIRRRMLPQPQTSPRGASDSTRSIWKTRAWPIVFGKTLSLVMGNIDLVLLGILMADLVVVGNYGIAHRMYALALLGLQAAQYAYGPRLTRAMEVRDYGVVRAALRSQRVFGLVTTVIGSIGAITLLPYVIDVLAPKYQAAVIPAQIMVFSTILAAISEPLDLTIEAMHKERLIMIMSVSLLIITVVLCFILIPWLGIIGVAIAVAAVQLMKTAMLLLLEQHYRRTSWVNVV